MASIPEIDNAPINDSSGDAQLPALPLRRRMTGRDIYESHRASSPLEALFDLTTVVAVAAVASRLHHDISGGHYLEAVPNLLFSFFAVWWSWMNFAWFSSAYDNDDTGYRLATLIQMVGVLLMASGLHQGAEGQFTDTIGFTVIRISMIGLWLRASREHPERRTVCRRYALGQVAVQSLWLLRIAFMAALPPGWTIASFVALAAVELSIPAWAERAGSTPWHPHHIAERYGLFTTILLGECMVGAASAMGGMLKAQGWSVNLAVVSLATVGLIFGLWWTYFLVPFAQVLHKRRERGFLWGYGHALVFVALAALSGVLEVIADLLGSPSEHTSGAVANHAVSTTLHHGVTPTLAIAFAAGAVLMFLSALWWLGGQTTRRRERSFIYLLPSTLVVAGAVAAVSLRLPLAWSFLLLAASPFALIVVVMRQRSLRPEQFSVR